jgi:hypothetical protein
LKRWAGWASVPWDQVRFWAWPQHALDSAGMQTHSEMGLDAFDQFAKASCRLVQTHLLQESQNLGTKFVPTPRAGPLRHKRWQATLGECCLGRVEHRS